MKFSCNIYASAGFLTILFVVLKITGVIGWDWIWVLSPILIPMAIYVLIVGVSAVGALLVFVLAVIMAWLGVGS